MEKLYCKNCVHFRQHYTLDKQKIFRVYCGHCTLQTVRKKRPDTIAYANYAPAPPDEDAFATKEYLSKTLLQYLLSLELLPEIQDAPQSDCIDSITFSEA